MTETEALSLGHLQSERSSDPQSKKASLKTDIRLAEREGKEGVLTEEENVGGQSEPI